MITAAPSFPVLCYALQKSEKRQAGRHAPNFLSIRFTAAARVMFCYSRNRNLREREGR